MGAHADKKVSRFAFSATAQRFRFRRTEAPRLAGTADRRDAANRAVRENSAHQEKEKEKQNEKSNPVNKGGAQREVGFHFQKL